MPEDAWNDTRIFYDVHEVQYSMSTTITTISYDACHILLSNADLARLTGLPTRELRSLQPMDSYDRVVAILFTFPGEWRAICHRTSGDSASPFERPGTAARTDPAVRAQNGIWARMDLKRDMPIRGRLEEEQQRSRRFVDGADMASPRSVLALYEHWRSRKAIAPPALWMYPVALLASRLGRRR